MAGQKQSPEIKAGPKRGCVGCLVVMAIFFIIGTIIYKNAPPPTLERQYSLLAKIKCVPAIDNLAKYGTEWAHASSDSLFPYARWLDPETKTIVRYSNPDDRNALRFKNAFGMSVPMWYICDIDVETEKVVNVEVWER